METTEVIELAALPQPQNVNDLEKKVDNSASRAEEEEPKEEIKLDNDSKPQSKDGVVITESVVDSKSPGVGAPVDVITITSSNTKKHEFLSMAGPGLVDEPIYAALCGVNLEEDEKKNLMNGTDDKNILGSSSKVFHITRPSTTIGRIHNGKASDTGKFIGLGKQKNLSRNHCRIYFRDKIGGTIDNKSDSSSKTWIYNKSAVANAKLLNYNEEETFFSDDKGNYCGCFAIEVVGKNKIMVDQKEVANSEAVLLKHGSAVQIGTWHLYFLFPNQDGLDSNKSEGGYEVNTEFVDVPNPSCSSKLSIGISKKRKSDTILSPTKKQSNQKPFESNFSGNMSVVSSNSCNMYNARLETLELQELLDKFNASYNDNQWTRKEQMMGTTIALHATKLAAQSPEIQDIFLKEGGVSRMDVIKWIEQHPVFGK